LTPPATAVNLSGKRPKFFKEKTDKALACGFGIVGLFCLIGAVAPGFFGKGYDEKAEENTSNRIAMDLYYQGYEPEMIAQIQPMLSIKNPDVKEAVESLRMSLVRKDSVRSLIFLLLGAGAVGIWRFNLLGRQRASTMASVGAIGVLVLIDLYSVNKRYLNHESFFIPELTVSETIEPTAVDKEIMKDTDPNYRVADFDRFGDAQPSYFHKMTGGYHAAKLGRYNDLINNGLISVKYPNILNMLNARYIVKGGEIYTNDMALGNAWFIDDIHYVDDINEEMAALPYLDTQYEAVADKSMEKILGKATAGSDGDSIVETSYAPNKLTYKSHTSSPRVAVFSEIYFPWGWEATIDGKPAEIARVNYVLRALVIPAGEHEIVMTFDPKSIHSTTTVATIAVILIYIAVVAAICFALFGCCKCKDDKRA
ncbi:MAG: YfhO family protein, partial [Bacteroides sp.]|nr:YfhO family protein [Bacteroides sp.]